VRSPFVCGGGLKVFMAGAEPDQPPGALDVHRWLPLAGERQGAAASNTDLYAKPESSLDRSLIRY
jgi:hypothetical protein